MKKILALVLCTVLMLALAVPAVATVNISANKATVNVDGVRDEAYGDASTSIAALKDGSDPAAASGKVWTAWDESFLYFYIEVEDKTPNHDTDPDNVEIMLDWNAGKGDANFATIDTPYWQVRTFAKPPNPDGAIHGGLILDGDNAFDWGAGGYFEEVCKSFSGPLNGSYNNGYVIEIAIAVSDGVTLTEGKAIPIEIQVCDNISGAAREGQRFLEVNSNNDSQWNTPSACNGLLTLGAAYVAPVAPAEETPAVNEAPVSNDGIESARTGDAGFIALALIMVAAAAGVVVFKKRASVK